jgi:hypothetical protein
MRTRINKRYHPSLPSKYDLAQWHKYGDAISAKIKEVNKQLLTLELEYMQREEELENILKAHGLQTTVLTGVLYVNHYVNPPYSDVSETVYIKAQDTYSTLKIIIQQKQELKDELDLLRDAMLFVVQHTRLLTFASHANTLLPMEILTILIDCCYSPPMHINSWPHLKLTTL